MTESLSKTPSAQRRSGLRAFRVPALVAAVSVTALTALPGDAAAQRPGFIPRGGYLYSGPGVNYPLVGTMPPGMQVVTWGCLSGWGWCDVSAGPLRGWAPGPALQFAYNGMMGSPVQYGAMLGLPLIPFTFDSYWGRYYRREPWFSSRDRWGGGPVRGGDRGGPGERGGRGPGGGPGR
ncbi:hypothetical protein GOB93_02355 [Acetobacter musti]|uniref:Peptide-binding protein n=1 Tax=Acetobacter musti TaxID=864732 RepID=A0ABX0JN39_9PROT|nr:hypothetical protein [Acetobacter musti]NHN83482.1 hypothetical protein [Acetobacter musti]